MNELWKKDLLANFPGIGRLRRIAKPLNWLLWGALVFAIAVNFFDEGLRPEVAAYLKHEKPSLPDENNAYYALAGLAAPAEFEAHAAGREFVAQLERAAARKAKGENAAWPKAFWANLMVREGLSVRGICNPARASCLGWVAQNQALAIEALASNQAMLARYRALHKYPGFAETRVASFYEEPSIGFGALVQAQRLFFIQTALQWQRSEIDHALAELQKDITFGRMGLAGSRSAWTKMSMNHQVAYSVLLLSDMLTYRRAEVGSRLRALDDVLRPLQDDERRLGVQLRGDFVMHAATIERIAQDDDWEKKLFGYVVKRNATINRSFVAYQVRSDADAVPAAQFLANAAAVRAALPSPDWTYFYNFFGKTAADILNSDVGEEYQYQMYDLDALLRLVALHAQLVAQRISDTDVQRFVTNAGERYRNPYTNQPMTWHEKTSQLCFEPQSARYGNPTKPPCCVGPLAGKTGPMCVRVSPPAA
jgi:hypothetical protein